MVSRKRSPDRTPLRGFADHLVAVGAVVGLPELGHVLHGAVHAERALRVRVGERAAGRFLRRHVLAPHLREAEEEALLGGESVDGLALLALQRLLVRAQRDRRAAEVRHRFAVYELAVDVDALRDIELAVLIRDAIRARLKIL